MISADKSVFGSSDHDHGGMNHLNKDSHLDPSASLFTTHDIFQFLGNSRKQESSNHSTSSSRSSNKNVQQSLEGDSKESQFPFDAISSANISTTEAAAITATILTENQLKKQQHSNLKSNSNKSGNMTTSTNSNSINTITGFTTTKKRFLSNGKTSTTLPTQNAGKSMTQTTLQLSSTASSSSKHILDDLDLPSKTSSSSSTNNSNSNHHNSSKHSKQQQQYNNNSSISLFEDSTLDLLKEGTSSSLSIISQNLRSSSSTSTSQVPVTTATAASSTSNGVFNSSISTTTTTKSNVGNNATNNQNQQIGFTHSSRGLLASHSNNNSNQLFSSSFKSQKHSNNNNNNLLLNSNTLNLNNQNSINHNLGSFSRLDETSMDFFNSSRQPQQLQQQQMNSKNRLSNAQSHNVEQSGLSFNQSTPYMKQLSSSFSNFSLGKQVINSSLHHHHHLGSTLDRFFDQNSNDHHKYLNNSHQQDLSQMQMNCEGLPGTYPQDLFQQDPLSVMWGTQQIDEKPIVSGNDHKSGMILSIKDGISQFNNSNRNLLGKSSFFDDKLNETHNKGLLEDDKDNVENSSRGLRNLSLKVKQIVVKKVQTSYKVVADLLVEELRTQNLNVPAEEAQKDEQNIKRRVYDALNVLIAANVIEKKGKVVKSCDKSHLNGRCLQTDNWKNVKMIEAKLEEKRQELKRKEEKMKQYAWKYAGLMQLIARNKRTEEKNIPSSQQSVDFLRNSQQYTQNHQELSQKLNNIRENVPLLQDRILLDTNYDSSDDPLKHPAHKFAFPLLVLQADTSNQAKIIVKMSRDQRNGKFYSQRKMLVRADLDILVSLNLHLKGNYGFARMCFDSAFPEEFFRNAFEPICTPGVVAQKQDYFVEQEKPSQLMEIEAEVQEEEEQEVVQETERKVRGRPQASKSNQQPTSRAKRSKENQKK